MKKNLNIFLQDLLQSLRHLRRTPWQSTMSVLGLTVGLVSLTLSANWLWTETHYDRFRPDYQDLYVMKDTHDGPWRPNSEWLAYPHIAEMQASLEGTEARMGMWQSANSWAEKKVTVPDRPDVRFYATSVEIDSIALRCLRPRMLAGSWQALFQGEGNILLTRTMATTLFHSPEAAVGRTVQNADWGQKTVVGVLDDCAKESGMYYDYLLRLVPNESDKHSYGNYNFVSLLRTADLDETLSRLPQLYAGMSGKEALSRFPQLYAGKRGDDSLFLTAVPLRMAHKMDGVNTFLEAYFYPLAFVVLSALLLLSALVNLVMSCTSVFLGRAREYALRRSLGASACRCDVWMLTDLVPVVGATALLGAVALEWLGYGRYVPGYADHVFVTYGWVLLGTLAGLLVAMTYPLWLMRRAYRRSFAGTGVTASSHAYLLVVQCFACALLLFLSWGMQRQLSGMVKGDLGFVRDNILRLYTGGRNIYGDDVLWDYKAVVRDLPAEFRKEVGAGITDALLMPYDLFNPVTNLGGVVTTEEVVRAEEAAVPRNWKEFYRQPEYAKYMGIRIMEMPYDAIRFFRLATQFGTGFSIEGLAADEWPAMLNRKAAEQLGVSLPAQDKFILREITGRSYLYTSGPEPYHFTKARLRVRDVANVRLTDFHSEEEPLLLLGVPEGHNCTFTPHDAVYIKHAPGRRADAEAAVRRVLVDKFDVEPAAIRLDDLQAHVSYTYRDETRYADLLTAMTAFSVLITFSGVFSLLLYSLRLRRRQMAIRRVMGAEFGDVLRATLWPYLVFTLLGGVPAYGPALYLMRRWMEYFHYGEAPGLGFMAAIVGGMLLVVFLLTYWQVRRAMKEKPVDVLRPEA